MESQNKILNAIEKKIFEMPAWKLVTLIILLMLFKTGIWCMPNLHESLDIALSPFENHENVDYLMWNWLSPFMAWLVGIKGFFAFFLFHLTFSVAFAALYIHFSFSVLREREARISIILFALLPVSGTAYFWVGVDSVVLFLMMLSLVFSKRPLIVFLIGTALGMQHFEQSLFAASVLMFGLVLSKYYGTAVRWSISFSLVLALGVVAGKLLLAYIFVVNDIVIINDRSVYLRSYIGRLLESVFFHAHYIIFSILGVAWVVAAKYTELGREAVPFLMTLLAVTLLVLFVADQTRVTAIILFYAVSVFWLFNQSFLEKLPNHMVSGIFLLWLLVPWTWVWVGEPRGSAAPYDIAYLLQTTMGWFEHHRIDSMWPFRPLWPM